MIDPKDCKPGEYYLGTMWGQEQTVMVRNEKFVDEPWESLNDSLRDDEVSDLVRLVPVAGEWTRDDLPSLGDLQIMGLGYSSNDNAAAKVVLDTVVEHLNVKYPKSGHCVTVGGRLVPGSALDIERKRIEQERDDAIARAEKLRNERDDALSRRVWRALGDAERERDEWKARAEAAEARTAVTREDVDEAVRGIVPVWDSEVEKIIAALHSLVSGDDPAVHVVRESDIAAVEVAHDERGWHARGATWSHEPTADGVRDGAKRYLRDVAQYEALARAIEAEQAVDPVTAKARELFNEAGRGNSGIGFDEIAPDHRGEYLRIARHVLGQEASSDE